MMMIREKGGFVSPHGGGDCYKMLLSLTAECFHIPFPWNYQILSKSPKFVVAA
jgi:hypothetical protein